MAINIQYNKTFLQSLSKALKVRENALPTLMAKESALRVEVKKAKQEAAAIENELAEKRAGLGMTFRLWNEFPKDLVKVSDVSVKLHKIAGVKTPVLDTVKFIIAPYSLVSAAAWLPRGIELLKEISILDIKIRIAKEKVRTLEFARRKTTQKVNLYEKVQIPGYREAILRIKRFLEDEDNLAKSSQKILKERLARAEAEAMGVAA
jgi:V/A-type H+/Na+-transporting ATPase subunit D